MRNVAIFLINLGIPNAALGKPLNVRCRGRDGGRKVEREAVQWACTAYSAPKADCSQLLGGSFGGVCQSQFRCSFKFNADFDIASALNGKVRKSEYERERATLHLTIILCLIF